jgi:hypothetical protein
VGPAAALPQDPPVTGEALAALIRLDLDAVPPLDVVVAVRTAGRPAEHVITGAASIPDGFARLDAFLTDNRLRPAGDFTVVLPRYTGDGPTAEQDILQIAHTVLAATQERGWRFAQRHAQRTTVNAADDRARRSGCPTPSATSPR